MGNFLGVTSSISEGSQVEGFFTAEDFAALKFADQFTSWHLKDVKQFHKRFHHNWKKTNDRFKRRNIRDTWKQQKFYVGRDFHKDGTEVEKLAKRKPFCK